MSLLWLMCILIGLHFILRKFMRNRCSSQSCCFKQTDQDKREAQVNPYPVQRNSKITILRGSAEWPDARRSARKRAVGIARNRKRMPGTAVALRNPTLEPHDLPAKQNDGACFFQENLLSRLLSKRMYHQYRMKQGIKTRGLTDTIRAPWTACNAVLGYE